MCTRTLMFITKGVYSNYLDTDLEINFSCVQMHAVFTTTDLI